MSGAREELAAIHTFPQLVRYLRDELDWPISTDDFEDSVFDYSAEDLGIDVRNAAKIEEIKRLRPLSVHQPWGIFFVKFEPKRLPVVALRRILSGVALKKRASANSADPAAWAVSDLLFISNYGEGDTRQIAFAHFAEDPDKGSLPTLKVLGWDNLDTPLHLDDVAESLARNLTWPDEEANVAAWRSRWGNAFTLGHREVINTSREMAIRLAQLARAIRDRIISALAIETDRGPLTQLMKAVQVALVHDLDAGGFADMYAQTIAYGLLSARIADPESKTAGDLAGHMRTNPLLRDLLETFLHVGGQRRTAGGPSIDFDELGVADVVELLNHRNIEAVLRDFGDRNPEEDPVIPFYELFLKEYDERQRMQRGVFYTPRQVVSYIVRSVDGLLRERFSLADGLADTTSWAIVAARNPTVSIPPGIDPQQPFVQVLDLATGTGTFLVETIEVIYQTLVTKWRLEGTSDREIGARWNEYVPMHLLPRLYGYELLMAPYAIAHLKVGLKLHETGYKFENASRVRVYLCNSLEPPSQTGGQLEFVIPALAHEAIAVNRVKVEHIFTVILGNPPYSVSSWNRGPWIAGLMEDYKRTVRQEESQLQALSNDYIKFLRFGEWQIERAGAGVLGLITGHGYLQGTQPRDLRAHLAATFAECLCIDLHGSVRRSNTADPDDEPVFQIMTGVAVVTGWRLGRPESACRAYQGSLTGRWEAKASYLLRHTTSDLRDSVEPHEPLAPNYHFSADVEGVAVAAEYGAFPDIPACFGSGDRMADKEKQWATGFTSQQDDLAIAFTFDELAAHMADLSESRSFEELSARYRLCTTDQWDYQQARQFARSGKWRDFAAEVMYRPFDRRWTVLHKHVLTIMRERVMAQLSPRGSNLALVTSRAVNDLEFAHCFVVDERVDRTFLSSKTSTNAYVFPLHRVHTESLLGSPSSSNLSPLIPAALARLGSASAPAAMQPSADPESVLGYLYAVLHSPGYRARYSSLLKTDFPRVPLPRSLRFFDALSQIGRALVEVHLLRVSTMGGGDIQAFGRELRVQTVSHVDDRVYLDKGGSTGIAGVTLNAWSFRIGGYQICEKWLKDRKGRRLSADDISQYQKIVVALSETIRLMGKIDEVIDEHGGWPGAFITGQT
jgi:Type ISP C-terminal specificity domain/N-6 DNA Methylase